MAAGQRDKVGWAVWGFSVAATTGWLALILSPPIFHGGTLAWLGDAVMSAYAPFCHQNPARSFTIDGVPLLACSRCTGIVAGGLIGFVVAGATGLIGATRTPRVAVLAMGLLPMFLDAVLGLVGLWANTHWTRSLTGLLAGFVVATFVLPALTEATTQILRTRGAATRAGALPGTGDENPRPAVAAMRFCPATNNQGDYTRKEIQCHRE